MAAPFCWLILSDGSRAAEPWWRNAVFYQVFVRSYADSLDGPLAGDGVGDFQGLIERLDYINDGDPAGGQDLGADAIWLLPIHPSPSYHGYDVLDYREVNPQYGDLATFRQFVAEAHRRGIRVIIDLVLNHTAYQHPWFQECIREDVDSPYRDYYRFSPERINDTGPWGEPCWHDVNGEYYYGVFYRGMPDLNFRHPPVTEYFYSVAEFWLKDIGVDGFRLDAVRFFFEDGPSLQDLDETKQWLREFRETCKSIRPDCFIVGEVWSDTDQAAGYVAGGSLDAAFEFDLAEAMIGAANFGTPKVYRDRMERVRTAFGDHAWAAFLANHDKVRTLTQLSGNRRKARSAAALLLSNPGIPFIYYGEEIGMSGNKPDPDLRTPMQWSDAVHGGFTAGTPWHEVNADYDEVNVREQLADPESLLNFYRDLIRLRNRFPAFARGEPAEFRFEGRALLAFVRRAEDLRLLFLMNLREYPRTEYTVFLPDEDPSILAAAEELLHGHPLSLQASAQDGELAWRPIAEIPPFFTYIISLPVRALGMAK